MDELIVKNSRSAGEKPNPLNKITKVIQYVCLNLIFQVCWGKRMKEKDGSYRRTTVVDGELRFDGLRPHHLHGQITTMNNLQYKHDISYLF